MSELFDLNYVDVRPPELATGLTQWHLTSTDVSARYAAGLSEIRRLDAAEPWGRDTAGSAFHTAYTRNGGPGALMSRGEELTGKVVELGPTVRRSAENARGMDAEQAREVREILRRA